MKFFTSRSISQTSREPADPERVRWPIRLKITLPYLLLSIIIAVIITALFWRITLETVDERYSNQLYEAGKLASEAMVTLEDRQLETLRLLANTEGMSAALQQYDSEKLRSLALGIVVNNQAGSVDFLDLGGNLVLGIRQKVEGSNQEYVFVKGGAPVFLDWPIVKNVLTGTTDKAGDKYAAYQATDWGIFFYVSGPIKDSSGKLVGVILVGTPLSSVVAELRAATLAQVTLYDLNGQVLISTYPPNTTVQTLEAGLAQQILTLQNTDSFRRDSSVREISSSGLNYGEILGAWQVRDGLDLGVLGVALVKNVLLTASLPTRRWIILFTFIIVTLVVLLGLNLSAALTRPLLKLMQASRQVASGDLSVKVPTETNDEVAVLAASFNKMIQSLQESHNAMIETYDTTLEGWAKALELRDKETSGHTQRVTDLTVELARRLNLPEDQVVHIRRGAMMHDIGKMGVPDHILLKQGPLTDEEWIIMRKHPAYAFEMLKDISYLHPAMDIPCYHHERWDGDGYPGHLKGESIPLAARLFMIVDTWDALTNDRPYHAKISPQEALKIIQNESGRQFDPALVVLFSEYIESVQHDLS